MKLDKVLLVIAIICVAYAIFSRFYGQPSIAFGRIKSSSLVLLANTLLLIGLFIKK
ncbi:MAG: hypothetical protein Q8O13_00795 [Candidatus Omnitrophota bacterium]|nr:hypothetical protein [Candidatus Omnitrophota bacterium]